jgi:hypothetical protein
LLMLWQTHDIRVEIRFARQNQQVSCLPHINTKVK